MWAVRFCVYKMPSFLLNLTLNLCINIFSSFLQKGRFLHGLCVTQFFWFTLPVQTMWLGMVWTNESCQKGLIYFYTVLLLSNAAHIFEIINSNVISFLSSISAVLMNHPGHFFSLTANFVKTKTLWLYLHRWTYSHRFNHWCWIFLEISGGFACRQALSYMYLNGYWNVWLEFFYASRT